jgi:hypothetical protein
MSMNLSAMKDGKLVDQAFYAKLRDGRKIAEAAKSSVLRQLSSQEICWVTILVPNWPNRFIQIRTRFEQSAFA